jgi:multiple antibiotic resistance protein
MFDLTLFLKDALSLLAIVEPLGAIPVFLTLTSSFGAVKQIRTAKRATMAGFLILLSALVFGKWLLQIFGISLSSIRVAGGLMFIVMGMQLVISEPVKITESEIEEAESHSDVAVVPLALPILSGPGAMGAVILLGSKGAPFIQIPKVGLIIGIVMFVSYICFRLARPIGKKLGVTGLNILNRISGLIVLAIGVEFILAGVHEIWKGL